MPLISQHTADGETDGFGHLQEIVLKVPRHARRINSQIWDGGRPEAPVHSLRNAGHGGQGVIKTSSSSRWSVGLKMTREPRSETTCGFAMPS